MIIAQASIYQQRIDDIIKRALRIIGKGDQVEPDRYAQAFTALQMLFNRLNALGISLWTITKTEYTLTYSLSKVLEGGKSYICIKDHLSSTTNKPGTDIGKNYWYEIGTATEAWEEEVVYEAANKQTAILFATFADNFKLWKEGIPKSLKHLSRENFNSLSFEIGEPEYVLCVFPNDTETTNFQMYFHPIPYEDNLLVTFDYARYLAPPESISEDIDIPPSWQNVLVFGLAADLAYEYGLAVEEITVLEMKARNTFLEVKRTNFERNNDLVVTSRF